MACELKKKSWGDKVDGLFDRMGDALSRADEKLTKGLNKATGKNFRNLFAVHEVEKVFSEWIREFHIQRNGIYEKAKETRDFLAGMDEGDSQTITRALNGDIDPKTLSKELRGVYDQLRNMIDANAKELVDLGVLKEENAIADYLKRYYKEFEERRGGMRMFFDKRFKARKDMTLDERLAAGMIEDASFVVPNTIAEQKIQALKARMLQGIAQRFAKDEAIDGYVRVSDETMGGGVYKYGALAGKYVPEEILKALNEASLVKEQLGFLENVIFPIVDHIKVNVTVKNPATHIYNVASNVMMSFLHGDMMALGRVLTMAAKDRAGFDALVSEAKAYGLNTLLDEMEVKTVFDPNKKINVIVSILKNLYATEDSKTGKAMRKAYEWEDKIFKIAAFESNMRAMREELGRDLSDAEKRSAFKDANEAYVDYDTPLPAMVRGMDKGGIFPFLHYTWKSTPVVLKAIAKNPMRFALLQAALIGMGASAWFSDDDDSIKPEWAADQANLLGAKEWINLGNGYFLNGGRLIPAAKIGGLDFQGGFVGGAMNIAQGMDTLGHKFVGKYDDGVDANIKRVSKLAESYAPPLSPIGRYGQRIGKKALGDGKKNSSTGKEMEYSEILQQPIGLRQFDPKGEAQKKAKAIENTYKHDIKVGMNESEAEKKYREASQELKAEAAKSGVVGLKLGDTPPKKKREGAGIGRVNIMPRLKL